jgi:hypothetical protein
MKTQSRFKVFTPAKIDAEGYASGTITECREVTANDRQQLVFDIVCEGVTDKGTPQRASLWTSRYVGKDKNGLWRLSKLLIKCGVITEAELSGTPESISSLAEKLTDDNAIMSGIEGLWLRFKLYRVESGGDNGADTERLYVTAETPMEAIRGARLYVDLDSLEIAE